MVNKDHDENGQDGDNKWYRAIIVRAAQGDKRAKKLQKIVEDSLKDKQEISRLKGDLRDRSTELAYYVSKQAGEQAAMPWEIFSRAQKSVSYSGQRGGSTMLDFWSDAEKHISLLTASALKTASSTVDTATRLAGALALFSPRAHLDRIQVSAYHMWEKAGRPYGHALKHWLQAEEAELSGLRIAAQDR